MKVITKILSVLKNAKVNFENKNSSGVSVRSLISDWQRINFFAGLFELLSMAINGKKFKGASRCVASQCVTSLWLILILLSFYSSNALGAVPGTVINNTASASYTIGAFTNIASPSNTITLTVNATASSSTIEFLQYAPSLAGAESVIVNTSSFGVGAGGPYVVMTQPSAVGGSLVDLTTPVPLTPLNTISTGEPIFIRVTDSDNNLNPLVSETVIVTVTVNTTGDTEEILLVETGPDTGVFTGFVQTTINGSINYNGVLSTGSGATVNVDYVDANDGVDTSSAIITVDNNQIIIDEETGLGVNGVTIRVVDNLTGLDAVVYGSDGINIFPSTITTGVAVTDGGGITYTFAAGEYRFPYIEAGNYYYEVTPPFGYVFPATLTDGVINALPNGPFELQSGSRGEVFTLNPGGSPKLDIPLAVDKRIGLFVTTTASKSVASTGEFMEFTTLIENRTGTDLTAIDLTTLIPVDLKYAVGSLKLNGVSSNNITVSANGKNLIVGGIDLLNTEDITVTFVMQVTASMPSGSYNIFVNAVDGTGTVKSNTEVVNLKVFDELSRDNIIFGTVTAGTCTEDGGSRGDGKSEFIKGARIYLEDGTFVTTDDRGLFHIEGVKSGTHVVQLDVSTIDKEFDLVLCGDDNNTRFAGNSISQFVDLKEGALWRTDFHLGLKPREFGEITVRLEGNLISNTVTYALPIINGSIDINNVTLAVTLPEGAVFITGSVIFNGETFADPLIEDGVLNFILPNIAANAESDIIFEAIIDEEGKKGDLRTLAKLYYDTKAVRNSSTPVVDNVISREHELEIIENPNIVLRPHFAALSDELNADDLSLLDSVIEELKEVEVLSIVVKGHSDSSKISEVSKVYYENNEELSLARADSVADYIASALGLDESMVETFGVGAKEPVATNRTADGRALNRRVELEVASRRSIDHYSLITKKDKSEERTGKLYGYNPYAETQIAPNEVDLSLSSSYEDAALGYSDIEADSFDGDNSLEIVWPLKGYYPPLTTMNMAVKHDGYYKVKLSLNGKEVDPLHFETRKLSLDERTALSLFRGIYLEKGDNIFVVTMTDALGEVVDTITRTHHLSTAPVKAELVMSESVLVGDGVTTPVVALRLTDAQGHPAREGMVGQLKVMAPFVALSKVEASEKFPLSATAGDLERFIISQDGMVYVKLKPTAETGFAKININLQGGKKEVQAWIGAGVRDLILVGFAEGTAGHKYLSGNMETGKDKLDKYDMFEDGKIAFYAKGVVKGDWIITTAYDSDKDRTKRNKKLNGVIDPGKYYTLYGDSSTQQYDGTSDSKLYLKIERDKFIALFGDYNTDLTKTELSRYSRTLSGYKTEFHGDKIDIVAFASETSEAFKKEEFLGDGTSGAYYLQSNRIVQNSEKISIEVRDRFSSEIVVSIRSMSRHLDYDIDYDSGAIYFREPISSKDSDLNPVFIVVDYETYDMEENRNFTYGTRVGFKPDENLEAGVTFVHEGTEGAVGDMYGVDLKVKLNDKVSLKAEIATTKQENINSADTNGNAYLTEINYGAGKTNARAYLRAQEDDFGFGQQKKSENGTRKYGVDVTHKLNDKVNIDTKVAFNVNDITDAKRTIVDTKVKYNLEGLTAFVGLRTVTDDYDNGTSYTTNQLTLGVGKNYLGGKLKLKLNREQSFGDNENADYPTRTTVGADYKINKFVTAFMTQEYTQSDNGDSESMRTGLKVTPWTGGLINTSVQRKFRENSEQIYANFAVTQKVQVTNRFSLDANFDSANTLKDSVAEKFNANYPNASGTTNDFWATSLGGAYRQELWTLSTRADIRNSDSDDKLGLHTAVITEPKPGIGFGISFRGLFTDYRDGRQDDKYKTSFNFVLRPDFAKVVILDKLDFNKSIRENSAVGGSDYIDERIVNSINLNWMPNKMHQVSLYYGLKFIKNTIANEKYEGLVDLKSMEYRRDASHRIDFGINYSMLNSYEAHRQEYSYGASIGYTFAENTWLSIGYNAEGFRDEDFSDLGYTAKGPYMKFRIKFDQSTVKEMLEHIK